MAKKFAGKKMSELSDKDKASIGLMKFNAKTNTYRQKGSQGEIETAVIHNGIIDDRTDNGKRKGLFEFPNKK